MKINQYPNDIKLFINEIVEVIKEKLEPEFILLAGSFGKDSWLYSKEELISDFEFVFVCKKKWNIQQKVTLLKSLNEKYPYEISLKGFILDKVQKKVLSNYAFKNPGYVSLDFFDTFSEPKIIYNRNNSDIKINVSGKNIPIWETWRLFANRAGDLLQIETDKSINSTNRRYLYLKMFESIADIYLIINNIYGKNINYRFKNFNNDLISQDDSLSSFCKDSFEYISKALLARKNHNISYFDIDIENPYCNEIILSWMSYIENKLIHDEKFEKDELNFSKAYLNKRSIQKKYLGFNYFFNTMVSNLIRFIYNPKLILSKIKIFKQGLSWRHMILLTITTLFYETHVKSNNLEQSRLIASKIFTNKSLNGLSNESFVNHIIKFWKFLR